MRRRVVLIAAYLFGPLSAAQAPSEADAILTRIRRQMAENLARLPNYTCVETIDRSERLELAREFQPVDRLHLEVAEASGNELFARAGGSQFEDKHPYEFAGWGAAGTGDFSLYARSVFVNDRVTFRHRPRSSLKAPRDRARPHRLRNSSSRRISIFRSTCPGRLPFHRQGPAIPCLVP